MKNEINGAETIMLLFVWFVNLFLRSAAIWAYWDWFLTQTMGAPVLGYWNAMGIVLFISVALHKYTPDRDKDEQVSAAAQSLSTSLIGLGFGALVNWVMP